MYKAAYRLMLLKEYGIWTENPKKLCFPYISSALGSYGIDFRQRLIRVFVAGNAALLGRGSTFFTSHASCVRFIAIRFSAVFCGFIFFLLQHQYFLPLLSDLLFDFLKEF